MVEVVGVTAAGNFEVLDVRADLDQVPPPEPDILGRTAYKEQGWKVVLRDAS